MKKAFRVRYNSLDSVRGVAAVSVLLHHAVMCFPGGGEDRQQLLQRGFQAPHAWLYATPLRLAVNGPAAVLLFFVLSGFVLTKSLRSDRSPSYGAFAASRFIRIWVPFAVAILLSVVLGSLLRAEPAPGTSVWFRFGTWNSPISAGNVLRHLLMTGTATDFDNPMWSLIHELRISFIFPVLVLCTIRWPWITLIASISVAFGCIPVVGSNLLPTIVTTWFQSGTYVYFFVFGILLALKTDWLRTGLASLPRAFIPFFWAVGLAALTIAPPDTSHVATFFNGVLLLASGLGASLIIALSISGGAAGRVLLSPIATHLGRVSYSLYLTHIIVLASVIHATAGRLPLLLSVSISVGLALIVADVFQRLIEAPSHRLAKRMAAHVDRHLRVVPAAAA